MVVCQAEVESDESHPPYFRADLPVDGAPCAWTD